MIGAIVGDVAGSRFEWHNVKKRPGNILDSHCFMTDDSLMTIAVAKAIVENKDRNQLGKDCIYWMQKIGRPRPSAGWGGQFKEWLYTDDPQPYNSLGNGSAMRVSAVAWAAQTLDECISMSKAVTEISHNHPEGIKGAEAIAVATFMALPVAALLRMRPLIRAAPRTKHGAFRHFFLALPAGHSFSISSNGSSLYRSPRRRCRSSCAKAAIFASSLRSSLIKMSSSAPFTVQSPFTWGGSLQTVTLQSSRGKYSLLMVLPPFRGRPS